MESHYSEDVFKHVLNWLTKNRQKTSKIALQKLLFFLQEKGERLGYNFEPYIYGPFSKKVMRTASKLQEQNCISVDSTEYVIRGELSFNLDSSEKERLDCFLDGFNKILEGNFSFENLELYGTTLYCMKALEENGQSTDESAVLDEFKAWKRSKYADDQIKEARERLLAEF